MCSLAILLLASDQAVTRTVSHMQVYYEDLDNGDRMEAYCNLVHCYSLPDDEDLWVEHGYFDDRCA